MMKLPKIESPVYEAKLLSDNKKIKFRPFLVKEEKYLLIASESEDETQIANAIENLLKNCVLDEDVKVENLPFFDVEYLFLKIREKSLGETLDVSIICPDTKKRFETQIDISNIKIEKSKNKYNEIKVNDEVGMIMKYPTFKITQLANMEKNNTEKIFKVIRNCVEKIYDKENTYDPKDFSEEEVQEFIESLPQSVFENINKFYDNFPKMVYENDVVSPFTGKTIKIRLENFSDFFA